MTYSQPEPGTIAAPPSRQASPLKWVRKNLFSTWYNILLTITAALVLYWFFSGFVVWLISAQWDVIERNLRLLFVGRYSPNIIWRVWVTTGLFALAGGLTWGILSRNTKLFQTASLILFGALAAVGLAMTVTIGTGGLLILAVLALVAIAALAGQQLGQRIDGLGNWLPLLWFLIYVIGFIFIQGSLLGVVPIPGLRDVNLRDVGFILTLLASITSIVLCFPFGVLLALGRQSNLVVIRWLCIALIEVIRGLPLITILFMAQVMMPLILPPGSNPGQVARAIAGLTIFAAAYLAENVRGGLQAIPRGQSEAARALGLNGFLVTMLIVLPQALKAVIPSIVGQFISLFKDTSLFAIVGLVELLGIAQSVLANPEFLGRYAEVYFFVALIYWVCCYAMALGSRQLEKQLNTGQR
jgi:general L-amino acid transport system permease protein